MSGPKVTVTRTLVYTGDPDWIARQIYQDFQSLTLELGAGRSIVSTWGPVTNVTNVTTEGGTDGSNESARGTISE